MISVGGLVVRIRQIFCTAMVKQEHISSLVFGGSDYLDRRQDILDTVFASFLSFLPRIVRKAIQSAAA